MTYSGVLADALKAYMTRRQIAFDFDSENGYFRTDFVLENGKNELEFGIAVLEDCMVSYALLPGQVPGELLPRTAEFLHRANYGLLSGNFELDYDSRRIQYKTFLHSGSAVPEDDQLESLFLVPFRTITRYIPGIARVLTGQREPVSEILQELEA